MKINRLFAGLSILPLLAISPLPSRAVVLSPVAATASSEFSSDFDIGNTIDQSGLSVGFNSGVDNFDTYIAGNPLHSSIAIDNEWFTSIGVTSAVINYDLGEVYSVDKFALWVDEGAGIGQFDLSASIDGVSFAGLLTSVSPINNPNDADYPAQVFALKSELSARYFRFAVSGCPQSNSLFQGCGIGEVAFNVEPVRNGDPVPGPLPLFGAIAAFGQARRMRRRLRQSAG